MNPASIYVDTPIKQINHNTDDCNMKISNNLATKKTPAATIVAACIKALTGVGPSIASGSHMWKGICALLPIAPKKRRNAIRVNLEPSIIPKLDIISCM